MIDSPENRPKKCSLCNVTKSLAQFLRIERPKKIYYGNVCLSCLGAKNGVTHLQNLRGKVKGLFGKLGPARGLFDKAINGTADSDDGEGGSGGKQLKHDRSVDKLNYEMEQEVAREHLIEANEEIAKERDRKKRKDKKYKEQLQKETEDQEESKALEHQLEEEREERERKTLEKESEKEKTEQANEETENDKLTTEEAKEILREQNPLHSNSFERSAALGFSLSHNKVLLQSPYARNILLSKSTDSPENKQEQSNQKEQIKDEQNKKVNNKKLSAQKNQTTTQQNLNPQQTAASFYHGTTLTNPSAYTSREVSNRAVSPSAEAAKLFRQNASGNPQQTQAQQDRSQRNAEAESRSAKEFSESVSRTAARWKK